MLYRATVQIFTCVLLAAPVFAAASEMLPPQPNVRPAGMPTGYVMISPCIPSMGEHWANPEKPEAPIYGSYEGKVVFSEIMIPKAQFVKGFNYRDLMALPGHAINHVDIEYEPQGHPGMPIPHYDIHAYYVSHDAHQTYCPAGGNRA
jgi:hypothetical protein